MSNSEPDRPDFEEQLDLPGGEQQRPEGQTPDAAGSEGAARAEPDQQAADTAAQKGAQPEPEQERRNRPGLLARLAATSPYVVLLAISLVAIVIGTVCLLLELKRYDFQIKPPQAGAAASLK